MPVGILALQGAFVEHQAMLSRLGQDTVLVRRPDQLDGLLGLILPGGESTVMRRLALSSGLDTALIEFAATRPLWGVCAGMILLATRVEGGEPLLGLLDMTVSRNAYGRQQDSFAAELSLEQGGLFPGVFIRAPRVITTGPGVEILARLRGQPVALRQGGHLAMAFHPELTADTRMHELFLTMCRASSPSVHRSARTVLQKSSTPLEISL